MSELPDIHAQIVVLCGRGDELIEEGKLEAAKQQYLAALPLLPDSPLEREAATWIYVAIGNVHFRTNYFDRAFKCFYNAVQCPKGLVTLTSISVSASSITSRATSTKQQMN